MDKGADSRYVLPCLQSFCCFWVRLSIDIQIAALLLFAQDLEAAVDAGVDAGCEASLRWQETVQFRERVRLLAVGLIENSQRRRKGSRSQSPRFGN